MKIRENGSQICPQSAPEKIGYIINKIQDNPLKYSVLFPGDASPVELFEEQLLDAEVQEDEIASLALDIFHAHLSAIQLKHPLSTSLYSLNAAKIDYVPYQFRPVLKFINAERPRLLIADSVGVGKTIEAGLILREAQARYQVRSVLIICPKPLVTEKKWQNEMKRFDEEFEHLDGKGLQYCIRETDRNGVWPARYRKAILPFSLLNEKTVRGTKKQPGLCALRPLPRFDLIIVDEAHKIRNPATRVNEGVSFLVEQAEAAVFLTATPLQLGNQDLYQLLTLLRPDYFYGKYDKDSFERYLAPNRFLNQAMRFARSQDQDWQAGALDALANIRHTDMGQAYFNDPDFQDLLRRLAQPELDREARVACAQQLESLHSLSQFINRTRRRDIGEFTKRKPETVEVDFTPDHRRLHDEIIGYLATIYAALHGEHRVNFFLSNIRRRLASCLFGIRPYLQDILSKRLPNLISVDADAEGLDSDLVSSLRPQMEHILTLAKDLDSYDPKLDRLMEIIREKQEMENNKIMLFSSFRHTLNYLEISLTRVGFRVGMIHGGIKDHDRLVLRNRFEQSRHEANTLDIMLFSEVGTEGLDYQFCDCLVNYDLPWNPMRIEQRIGRLDRRGQKSPVVPIYNLVVPGTVDFQIYDRCLTRIGIFESSVGDCEEILGQITSGIKSIVEDFSLSPEELSEKLHQLADNEVRLLNENEKMENQQYELFGFEAMGQQFEEAVAEARNFWLAPAMLQNMIEHYLAETCGERQRYIVGDGGRKTLRLSHEARGRLHQDFLKLPHENTPTARKWQEWLEGSQQHLSITFAPEVASHDDSYILITAVHALVTQASRHFGGNDIFFSHIRVQDEEIEPGTYLFALYQWNYRAGREHQELRPVCADSAIHGKILQLIQRGQTWTGERNNPQREDFAHLEQQHHQEWQQAREHHRTETRRRVGYQRRSLETSHRARIALLQDKLNQNESEKIKQMHHYQIANAETVYLRRVEELDRAERNVDIHTHAVAYCVLNVERGS